MKSHLIEKHHSEYLKDLNDSVTSPVQKELAKYFLCHSCRNTKGEVVRLDTKAIIKKCDNCDKKRWVSEYVR